LGGPGCFGDKYVEFRVIREPDSFAPEFLRSIETVINYFDNELAEGKLSAINNYITWTKRTHANRSAAFQAAEKESQELQLRIETLTAASSNITVKQEQQQGDELAKLHGSKPAALVRHLRKVVENDEKTIVFSYWHDTLKLIKRTLNKCGLSSVFCEGHQTSKALLEFTTGSVPIILLSAQSKASGANLQCATHVILLDPAGSSAEHGSTLEEQAVGRAVRMGQECPVTVTRFCVVGTLEETLFMHIDKARETKLKRANDSSYVIQDSNKTTPKNNDRRVVEKNNNNEIEVTAALTQEERLQRDFKEAEEKGNVIVVLDDSDDDDEDKKIPKTPVTKTPRSKIAKGSLPRRVRVKPEPVCGTKRNEAENQPPDENPAGSTRKRVRTNVDCGTQQDTALVASTPKPTYTSSTTRATVTPLTREVSMEDTPTEQSTAQSAAECHAVLEMLQARKTNIAVQDLLDRFELSEYGRVFHENNYESISWLYENAENVDIMETLANKVGFKNGHAIRFQMKLVKEANEQMPRIRRSKRLSTKTGQ
jgi:uncharacterized protein YccT (UPF0319 family)